MILSFEGDNGKPFKPCKTMGRAMVMLWSLTDDGFEEQVKGKAIRVYRDPEVTFGDQGQVGGIRISHASHIARATPIKLTVSQGKKSVFTFHPLVTEASATQQTADLTLDQARADIAAAQDLDALKVVWQRKSMAPFRDELKGALDAQKAALSFEPEGRADTDHGDQHDGSVADDLNDGRGGEDRG